MSYMFHHPQPPNKRHLFTVVQRILAFCLCFLLTRGMIAPSSLAQCTTLALAKGDHTKQESTQSSEQIYPQTEEYLGQHLDMSLIQDTSPSHDDNNPSPLSGFQTLFSLSMNYARALGASLAKPKLRDSGHTMTVKYTLADADVLAQDATLDSIWAHQQTALDTIVGQYESAVHLFDASDTYYAAFIDATKLTHGGTVYDTVFAVDNTSSTRIQGVIYDSGSGIAYIPKTLFTNQQGQEIAFGMQAQQLVGIKLKDGLQTQFQVRVTSDRKDVKPLAATQVIDVDSLENTVTIPLLDKAQASKISLDDLVAYTDSNSQPYKLSAQKGAYYDKNTGELTLALSPFAQPSITLKITSKKAIDMLMDTLAPATPAYGLAHISNPDEMAMWPWGKFDSIDLSQIHVGDKYEFKTNVSYDSAYFRAFATNCSPYIYAWTNNSVGYKGEESTEVLIDKLLSGATWDDMANQLAKLSEAEGTAINLVDDVAFALSFPWKHSSSSGWDFSGLHANDPHTNEAKGSGVLPMLCGHVKQPKNVVKPGTYSECTAMLRVLAKKETGDTPYVVLGFVSPQVTTQSGVAVVKFGVLQPKIQTELLETTNQSHTIAHSDIDEVATTAEDATSKDSVDTVSSSPIKLQDKISYSGLVTGASYSLKASLVDADTGKKLDPSFGSVVCEEKFSPKESSGTIDLHFSLDDSNELPHRIVSCVSLFDASGQEIVKHHGLNNKQQTVWIPTIVTHLICDLTQEQMVSLDATQQLTDKTQVHGLIPGTKYILKSELIDADEEQHPVLSEQSYEFVAQDTDLDHDSAFELDRQSIRSTKLVAQTSLYEGTRCVATHARLDNEQQTITVPAIKTQLINKQTSDKTIQDFPLELSDTVSYSGLTPGKSYKMVGLLMDKKTKEPLRLNDKQLPASEVEFTPDTPSGEIEVSFTIDKQPDDNIDVVAFEKLYLDEVELDNHEDFDDADQSFSIPKPPEPPTPPTPPTPPDPPTPPTPPEPPTPSTPPTPEPPTPPQPKTPPETLQQQKIKLPKTGDLLSVGFITCLVAGGWFAIRGSRFFGNPK